MILILILSCLLLVFGLIGYYRLNKIVSNGVLTKGVILKIAYDKKTHDENRHGLEYYTLRYYIDHNEEVIAETNFGLSTKRLNIGDEIPLIYDRNNPREPLVFPETQKLFHLIFIILSTMGLVFSILVFLFKIYRL